MNEKEKVDKTTEIKEDENKKDDSSKDFEKFAKMFEELRSSVDGFKEIIEKNNERLTNLEDGYKELFQSEGQQKADNKEDIDSDVNDVFKLIGDELDN